MVYSTPIKKNLWTNKIQDNTDVQLFICHLLLDLNLAFVGVNSFLEFVSDDDKPSFTRKGAAAYEILMTKCYGINKWRHEYDIIELWPELGEWFSESNDSSTKSIQVKNISTGKIMYIAKYRSDFPLISVLFTVDNSGSNKQYKKVGYGTASDITKPYEGEQFYSIYDNELKKHFEGMLYKLDDGSFSIFIGLKKS